jgi:acyl-CoA hydrolase
MGHRFVLGRKFFAERFHLGQCVLIAGPVGGGDAFVQAGDGAFRVGVGGHGLRGHLVGGDVVGVVGDAAFELGESLGDAGLGDEFHGQAVAGEGVGGVLGEDLQKHCELVHVSILKTDRVNPRGTPHCKLKSMSDAVITRRVSESQSERSEIIFPADANTIGNLFGGRLMQFIDLVGAMAASRHARAITITASMDHLDFVAPVHVGDLLILKSSVNRAFKTSMEVGVKAMVEDIRMQQLRHVSSAYLTYVAVDREGCPIVVPQLLCETDHQRRRYEDAGRRREMRSGEVLRKKRLREQLGAEWNV